MASKNPERLIFQDDRDYYVACRNNGQRPACFVRDTRGWILFGPYDIRGRSEGFLFCLQRLPGQKLPRVRAGCRYFTLKQAYAHWSRKAKKGFLSGHRNEGKQALAIIRLMLLQAQAYGLISPSIKFDSTILRPKRK
jgi:hypothetical protein